MTILAPIGLEIDGALAAQGRLSSRLARMFDLKEFSREARLRCGRTVASRVRERIVAIRKIVPEPWLAFFGSGDFHHLSLLLLETLPASRDPVTLVLIDNHPDWTVLPPRYHCGNWVAGALGLPRVERAVLIGMNGPDLRPRDLHFAPLRDVASGRAEMYPWECAGVELALRRPEGMREDGPVRRTRRGCSIRWATMAQMGADATFARVAGALEGRSIYLSIDKDCLRSADAASDWEQGAMSLDELVRGLRLLRAHCMIVGADVCGERAPAPLAGFIKRLDAGRVGAPWRAPSGLDVHKNQSANMAILRALTTTPAHVPSSRTTEATAWTPSHGS